MGHDKTDAGKNTMGLFEFKKNVIYTVVQKKTYDI